MEYSTYLARYKMNGKGLDIKLFITCWSFAGRMPVRVLAVDETSGRKVYASTRRMSASRNMMKEYWARKRTGRRSSRQ